MKREIKFRVWEVDKMLYSGVYDMGWYSTRYNDENGCHFARDKSQRDHVFPLMQYVGLKDKNGTEIYEGDFVLIPNESVAEVIAGWTRYETNNIIAEVKINPYGVLFISDEFNSDGYISLYQLEDEYCGREKLEIIGNIWEDPHLSENK